MIAYECMMKYGLAPAPKAFKLPSHDMLFATNGISSIDIMRISLPALKTIKYR